MPNLPHPRDNQWLFLDMNAFFASCEQHRRPELRGRPVAVTPSPVPSGCVIAASYEAKRRGVTTGCRVGEARARIPDITIVEAAPRYYVAIHRQIATFLTQEITPAPQPWSIDEFALPLDKNEQWTPRAHQLARRIKARLETIFSPYLRCSIGIGPNQFLAKLGTEIDKPNGLVIIQLHTLEAAYRRLSLRDIPGINWGMSHRLHGLGIGTPVDFWRAPPEFLRHALGRLGDAWWHNLHGYVVERTTTAPKSLSHSHVLGPPWRAKQPARSILYKLFWKILERLRAERLATTQIIVTIADYAQGWETIVHTRPTQGQARLFRVIGARYDAQYPTAGRPIKITVVARPLGPASFKVLPLFRDDNAKYGDLLNAADKVNQRFGRWTIQPASLLSAGPAAPNRIPFGAPGSEMD